MLLTVTRSRVRAAWSPAVLAWGAVGYGGTVLLQNAGITRTSVSHAALLIGTAPVMVAIIAVVWHRSVVRLVAWARFAVSLGGVGLIAAGGGGGSTMAGDGMVLASVLFSAIFTVGQTRLLRGRDPIAVTALQFLGAALVTAPFSALTEGLPSAPAHASSLLAVVALIAGGTLLPFTLFAFGQSRLPAEIAGAFLNIEPLVGAVAGVVVFGDPAGPAQIGGGAAILGGIALSSLRRPGAPPGAPAVPAVAAQAVAEPVTEPVGRRRPPGLAARPAGRSRLTARRRYVRRQAVPASTVRPAVRLPTARARSTLRPRPAIRPPAARRAWAGDRPAAPDRAPSSPRPAPAAGTPPGRPGSWRPGGAERPGRLARA